MSSASESRMAALLGDDPLAAVWEQLPRAHGSPVATGLFRCQADDFRVEELLRLSDEDSGEHLWLKVRKRDWTTMAVAAWLAQAFDVPAQAVTWAGLKDRVAVADQWFGVHLPGRSPALPEAPEGLIWLVARRQTRKLRIGGLQGNRFQLVLRDVDTATDPWLRRVLTISRHGVPNYFGPQRFGHAGSTLRLAARLVSGGRIRNRQERSLALSAARSCVFNRVLAERVPGGCWERPMVGDLMTFEGSRSLFPATGETVDDPRLAVGDIHPTAPLPGQGGKQPVDAAAEWEQERLQPLEGWVRGIQTARVEAGRRATRVLARDLHVSQLDTRTWALGFRLPAGSYATSVLRELGEFRTP